MLGSRTWSRVGALFAWLIVLGSGVRAQDVTTPAGGAKEELASLRQAVLVADSARDGQAAFKARMALAALSKSREAQVLYAEAVQLADSLGLGEEEVRAREALAMNLAARGDHRQAFEQAMELARTHAARGSDAMSDALRRVAEIEGKAAAQRDSLARAGEARLRDAEERVNEAQENADTWMWIALALLVLAIVALGILLVMQRRSLQRHRAEVQALRSEVSALAARYQNRARESPVTTPTPPPPVVAPRASEVPVTGLPVVDDPVVVAMFRKQAPERLAALQDARTRGDVDKVQRVVRTLKPPLLSLDPGCDALVHRLLSSDAPARTAEWDADLDAFVSRVTALLA